MDSQAFLAELPGLWASDPLTADFPIDRRFGPILEATRGMASENKLAVLNLAARHLSPGEIYLEVGAWAGCSIVGASLGNAGPFVTVDDFSLFGGPLEECRRNIETLGDGPIELIDASAWDVLATPPFSAPVGVYFYDGGHTFDDQYRAFEIAERLLADEALVIVDDTNFPEAKYANRAYVRTRPQYERVLAFDARWNGDPRWWNGIEVYVFRRDRGPGRAPSALGIRMAKLDVERWHRIRHFRKRLGDARAGVKIRAARLWRRTPFVRSG